MTRELALFLVIPTPYFVGIKYDLLLIPSSHWILENELTNVCNILFSRIFQTTSGSEAESGFLFLEAVHRG